MACMISVVTSVARQTESTGAIAQDGLHLFGTYIGVINIEFAKTGWVSYFALILLALGFSLIFRQINHAPNQLK